jgi:uncharacterized protein
MRPIAAPLLACLVLLAAPAAAVPIEEVPNPRARDGTWVTDLAGVLRPDSVRQMNALLERLRARNGTEVAVVTVPDTDGRPAKPFATALFNRWGIGQRGVDNGVLFLVVMGQRRMEVEVGDGARRWLPDATIAPLLSAEVVPHFKRGNPDLGVLSGTMALAARLEAASYGPAPAAGAGVDLEDGARLLGKKEAAALRARLRALRQERSFAMALLLRKAPLPRPACAEATARGLGGRPLVAFYVASRKQVEVCSGPRLDEALPALEAAWARRARPLLDRRRTHAALSAYLDAVEQAVARLRPEQPVPVAAAATPAFPAPAAEAPQIGAAAPVPRTLLGAGGGALGLLFGGAGVAALRRRRPRRCPRCGAPMRRLREDEEDAHLSAVEQLEEELGSVDYDVWRCGSCKEKRVEDYNAWWTAYSRCGPCGRRTLETTSRTVVEATYDSAGEGERTSRCRHCSHEESSTYVIAQLTRSESSSAGSSGSAGSDGGSSFGGGSSSGGGDGASW